MFLFTCIKVIVWTELLEPSYMMTDSDDGMLSMDDDFPESDDDAGVDDIDEDYIINMEQEMDAIMPKAEEEDHLYEILTGDQVVELMQEIIREVNIIVQVCWLCYVLL